ncbi:MAG: DoxX family protein [Saprospiraceae bacterium]|nr:DoxX family protein [Bacteroidota bacterium]MCB9313972.1 DoxX family protein [Lewinellaceae bacterium]
MSTKELSKTRKISSWVIVGLLGALFAFSSFSKIAGAEMMAANFEKWGLSGWLTIIGIGELVSAILYLIPRTSSLGVLLLSAHMGGAIVIHMSNGEPFIFPAVLLLLVWVGNYLRNTEMLSSFNK